MANTADAEYFEHLILGFYATVRALATNWFGRHGRRRAITPAELGALRIWVHPTALEGGIQVEYNRDLGDITLNRLTVDKIAEILN